MATTPTLPGPGALVQDTWKIIRELGEDNATHDALFVAERSVPKRTVALRMLHPRLVAKDKGRARFEEIAAARGAVHSEHVIELVDAGIDKTTGAPWFATPFLACDTLAQYADGALDPVDALEVLEEVAHGLRAVHKAGWVHAALDPAKIFVVDAEQVASESTVKLNDFWTAAWLRETDERDLDRADRPWAAPEVSNRYATLTPAADVWSFGLLAFRMLTGKAFWEKPSDEVEIASARAEELGFDGDLPDGFDAWFEKCLEASPGDRYATIDAAFDALAPLLGEAPGARADAADEEEEDDEEDEAPPPPPRKKSTAKRPRAADNGPLGALGAYLPEWARTSDAVLPAALILATVFALGVRQMTRSRQPATAPGAAAISVTQGSPSAAAPVAAAPSAPIVIEIDQRMTEDLVRRLGAAPHGTPAWIVASQGDPGSAARAEQLRTIFTRAGWNAQPVQQHRGTIRPGYFLFAADESPAAYVTTLGNALRAVGMISNFSSGYRAYYRERLAADPNFVGFSMTDEQTFVLVVGRTP